MEGGGMTTDELKIWERLNECECVKRVFGNYFAGDNVYLPYADKILIFGYKNQGNYILFNDKGAGISLPIDDVGAMLWIPPLFDSLRPERSLIGIYKSITGGIIKSITFTDNRPDLALARAIIEQEGE